MNVFIILDVANGMDTEDGVIWAYSIGDDQVMAFTDFGIENLTELIRMHKEDPELLKRWDRCAPVHGLARMGYREVMGKR